MDKKKGFTIIELLGVLSILVIISLFSFPLITSLMTDSNNTKNEQFLETMYQAAEVYVEINYDKYKNEEIGYINAKKLVEEGLLQTDFTNPITKEKIINEDGIIEVSRNSDNTFKFNYVINQYITINYIEDLIEILNSNSDYANKVIILARNLDIKDDKSYKNTSSLYNGVSIKAALTRGDLIPKINTFKGTINGNGYEISNINIESNNDNIGLFSSLTDAKIENIKLSGQVSGKNNVGLLCGNATNVNIKNVSVDAKISFNSLVTSDSVGGLIGTGSNINISNVVAKIDFTVNGSNIGGIVGKLTNNSKVSNIKQDGFINGIENVGGIIGISENTIIDNSTSNGKIFGDDNIGGIIGNSKNDKIDYSNTLASVSGINNIGGIVGNSSNIKVTKNYSVTEISGTTNIGGIIGYATGSTNITKSNSSAKINGTENAGGIAGSLSASTISDCYSISEINADKQVGGIVGTSSSSTIKNTYYSGKIISNNLINIGGIAGLSSSSNLQNSYYNNELIPVEIVGNSTNDTITNVSSKKAEEMKLKSTYQNWDFNNTWIINTDSFPTLR